ncbi:beta-aspartyl-peptidase [Nonlabens spongiae]|uniref:Isoaspartyl peptidase n=1 Tax=Nonlabens spongiae TaxID=331648 RepID=A0A1W6MLV5_9FLAO|nr:isoaspartyl peptidase/L-asparaginase [Nonlabens spongiae]ARN78547.1 beta-aspartyl-peptidase [Nonlabens spongiae]
MRFLYIIVFLGLIACNGKNEQPTNSQIDHKELTKHPEKVADFAIVIHGGAGTIKKENMTPELEKQYNQKLTEAVEAGHKILTDGGTAMDAVEESIRIMEDSPLFNSGKGAVFTHDGVNSLDASFMDGSTLNAGAVAGVTTVKNPISLARKVMTDSKHVLLSGSGAEEFAASLKDEKIEIVENKYFFTQNRYDVLQRVITRGKKTQKQNLKQVYNSEINPTQTNFVENEYEKTSSDLASQDPFIKDSKYGTVGCVALDKNGNIAAGTSTGGMTNKKYGRIGDSPIIGSGTYANNATCGVSSTGHGEYFIRAQVAYDISALMEYGGLTLKEATDEVIQKKLVDLGGTGGIVALDHLGNISMEFNTAGMYRAYKTDNNETVIGMYRN